MKRWVVVLIDHERKPWSGKGGLTTSFGETAIDAARLSHENPPSFLGVRFAWAHLLAEPYDPQLIDVDVPKPEWGRVRSAVPTTRDQRLVEALRLEREGR